MKYSTGRGTKVRHSTAMEWEEWEKKKRHPTIGDGVVIGAGATILGPINVGRGARIGAGSVVVKAVPAGATIVGVPGRIAGAERTRRPAADLEHGRLPDPVW